MSLTLDAHGISVQLKIHDYEFSQKEFWKWCKCDFAFRSGEWLDYHKENEEVLLLEEIEELVGVLGQLLQTGRCDKKEFCCMEPDFEFSFHPKRELSEEPDHKQEDISVEWKVRFWNDGLTDNFLTVTLNRENIVALRNYLYDVSYRKWPIYQSGKLVEDSGVTDDFHRLIGFAKEVAESNHLKEDEIVIAGLSTRGNIY